MLVGNYLNPVELICGKGMNSGNISKEERFFHRLSGGRSGNGMRGWYSRSFSRRIAELTNCRIS